jgi:hypothetical protein
MWRTRLFGDPTFHFENEVQNNSIYTKFGLGNCFSC